MLASRPVLEGLFGEGACSVCYFGITLWCLGLRREAESFSSLPFAGWEISLRRALPSLPQLLSEKSSRHCVLTVPKFALVNVTSHSAFSAYRERRYPVTWV